MPKLGVNIDHVATLRQARKTFEPSPVEAAASALRGGADSIVCHLREDRRHINDKDLYALKKTVKSKLNLEMSAAGDIVKIAMDVFPDQATFVPERRMEVTTEGGIDLIKKNAKLLKAIGAISGRGIAVSLFIDPDRRQIGQAVKLGIGIIELHTGEYANASNDKAKKRELARLVDSVKFARDSGLIVNAGHGLNYKNTSAVARIEGVEELNIGHSIIACSIFVGLEAAVRKMKGLIK